VEGNILILSFTAAPNAPTVATLALTTPNGVLIPNEPLMTVRTKNDQIFIDIASMEKQLKDTAVALEKLASVPPMIARVPPEQEKNPTTDRYAREKSSA
jgi:hypothetical protein